MTIFVKKIPKLMFFCGFCRRIVNKGERKEHFYEQIQKNSTGDASNRCGAEHEPDRFCG